jgi:NAD(P)-dependent dehydrogenase (short-subunit alcohol dehydrogenase family)
MLLNRRVALVTGGGRGIGRGVALLARTAPEVTQVAAELSQLGKRSHAAVADVASLPEVVRAVEQISAALGPIDILVNNAAIIGPLDAIDQVDPAAWAQTQQVNLLGAFFCQRSVLPGMLARGWGRIVHVSSGAATGSGLSRASAYSVSKAALDMLARATAAEVGAQGVAVTSVYPGIVDTAMQATIRAAPTERAGTELVGRFRDNYAQGRLADPEQVGALIAAVVLGEFNGELIDVRTDRERLLALLGRAP